MSDAHHKLLDDLRGLVDAAELHDQQVIDDFNQHSARLDSEYELRTEPWAPPNSADDEALEADLRGFREWAVAVLRRSGDGRLKALGRLPAEDGRRRRPPAGPALSS